MPALYAAFPKEGSPDPGLLIELLPSGGLIAFAGALVLTGRLYPEPARRVGLSFIAIGLGLMAVEVSRLTHVTGIRLVALPGILILGGLFWLIVIRGSWRVAHGKRLMWRGPTTRPEHPLGTIAGGVMFGCAAIFAAGWSIGVIHVANLGGSKEAAYQASGSLQTTLEELQDGQLGDACHGMTPAFLHVGAGSGDESCVDAESSAGLHSELAKAVFGATVSGYTQTGSQVTLTLTGSDTVTQALMLQMPHGGRWLLDRLGDFGDENPPANGGGATRDALGAS